ncbi:GerAB/ArcD/ProY family transporter [Bacillus sp. FJAT-28004]|uniref:GerAB/ArcD/ProY family transporter n=1 Tax=Bacillus sp. FJAT-28004 TaxID=1679165 RepID=UPI0006B5A67E|nr:GerAB/ArcD/ProY family transporter [Bacillus sp. FJAT-28004]
MTQRLQIWLVFIIMNMGFGFLMYPHLIYTLSNSGHWAVVLSYGLLQLILMMIFKKGLDYFPKKDVIDICLQMGRWAAFIFFIPYVINLTVFVAITLRAHSEDVVSVFLIRTPYWAVLVLLFFISTYTAIKGLGTILRSSAFIFFIINFLVVLVIASSTINFDFQNAAPAWPSSFNFLLKDNFFYLMGYSAIIFLGFVPAETNLKFGRLFAAWVYVIFSFLTSVYVPLLIFGQETVVTIHFPAREAADTVDMRWFVFSRQTMFFGLSLIGFTIILNAVLLWMIGQIMQKTLKWQRSKASYWISAFSLIAFIFAVTVPNRSWIVKLLEWSNGANVYFIIILPSAIFIYGVLIRRRMAGYEKN